MTVNMTDDLDNRYLTAAEAARALRVNLQTLYVYVGRKGIRSKAIPGSRQRKYWKADIERLIKGEPLALVPHSADFRQETAITLITENDLFYRGQSAVDLARTASFESIAALLWGAREDVVFAPRPSDAPAIFARLNAVLQGQDDLNRAIAMFPILEDANPRAFDLSPEGMARTGADVLRWLAALVVEEQGPSSEPIHLFLARKLGASAAGADLIRRVLVLAADHGFEPGTVAVRAVASTGVTPWRSVIAGLTITFGRRGKLGGFEAIRRLLREIEESPDPVSPVMQRIKDGEDVPGFDSAIYAHGDPRGRELMRAYGEVLGDDESYKRLQKALATVRDIKGAQPNFALTSLFISNRIGLGPRNALFHLGRSAGWIAHAIEQYQAGEMRHQVEVYTGPLPG